MDKKIANNIIVGVMVALGFVAFVFVLFNIGVRRGLAIHQFALYATFHHVKGLHMAPKSPWRACGSGVVKKITVADDKNKDLIVELSLARTAQEYIRKGFRGGDPDRRCSGDKYIEISFGRRKSPVLKHGDAITSLEAEDMFSQGGKLMGGLSKKFSDGGDFDSVMRNLNTVAKNLATITTEFRQEKKRREDG